LTNGIEVEPPTLEDLGIETSYLDRLVTEEAPPEDFSSHYTKPALRLFGIPLKTPITY
jgi:hypothetical protein